MRPMVRRFIEQLEKQLDERVPEKGENGWHEATTSNLAVSSHFHGVKYGALFDKLKHGEIPATPENLDELMHELVDMLAYRVMIFDNIRMGRSGALT